MSTPDIPPSPQRVDSLRRRKRTLVISIVAIGAAAAGVYALATSPHCETRTGPDGTTNWCRSAGGGSGAYFYGGGRPAAGATVARGGFGASGAAHAGGGT